MMPHHHMMAMAPVMSIHYMTMNVPHNAMMSMHHPMVVMMMMAAMCSCRRLCASKHKAKHSKHRKNAK
jgi:hypothetical protein